MFMNIMAKFSALLLEENLKCPFQAKKTGTLADLPTFFYKIAT
jgi:hypothetical protein